MLSNGDWGQIQGGGEFADVMATVALQKRQNLRFRVVHKANPTDVETGQMQKYTHRSFAQQVLPKY